MSTHRLTSSPAVVLLGAVFLAGGLAACDVLGLAPRGPQDDARLHAEAQAALARWADAVVAAGGPRGFVPVGEMTGQIGDWEEPVGDNNKRALYAGQLESVAALPAEKPSDGQVEWQGGKVEKVPLISAVQALADIRAHGDSQCGDCRPLRITGASLTTGPLQTSRGPATVPMWAFTVEGTAVKVTRVAVAAAVAVVLPPWDSSDPPVGIAIDSATGRLGTRQLTVSFTGAPGPASQACGADYTGEAVESATAVVVIVREHANPTPGACTAVGATRTATVALAAPLGDRAVLEVTQGRPVAVVLAP